MESLEFQFARTLITLGYPGYSSPADLAAKISWITDFEKPRVLVEWICQNLTTKNTLRDDQLRAYVGGACHKAQSEKTIIEQGFSFSFYFWW